MKIQWTERATADLTDIGRYIADDSPLRARQWEARLRKRAWQAVESPCLGRRVPELARDDIRELIERNYRIVYRVEEDAITVLTVSEGHRLFPTDVLNP